MRFRRLLNVLHQWFNIFEGVQADLLFFRDLPHKFAKTDPDRTDPDRPGTDRPGTDGTYPFQSPLALSANSSYRIGQLEKPCSPAAAYSVFRARVTAPEHQPKER